jgi:preprotein translocase subunit SecE
MSLTTPHGIGVVVLTKEDKLVAKTKVTRRQENVIVRTLRETAAELRKVTWPTRQEAIQLTLLVLVVIIISSIFLGTLDFLFARIVASILRLG